MPVSTFSSDTTSIRGSSGHAGMVARWNSTRDRISEDERRMSMNEVVEMDGTGLHERDNWPLVDTNDRSTSPDTVVSIGNGSPTGLPKFDDGSEVDGRAVLRKQEDIVQLPVPIVENEAMSDNEEHDVDSISDDGIQPSEASAQIGAFQRSPVDDIDSEDLYSSHSQDDPPDVSPMRSPHLPTGGEDSGIQETQTANLEAEDPNRESGSPNGQVNGYNDEHDVGRDLATPIQFVMDNAIESPLSSPSSLPPYGRVTPSSNGHMRQGSMVKSTPPSRSASRRSQQITPLRDRVRYSWQSMQDEEPNRPRIHIIKLISNTATASAGFPQGEAFGFSISPSGRRLAAYNSARLYILQTAALPVGISQDFALRRRPLAVEIVDEGNVLAILADDHTINLYDLGHQQLRRIRTVKTDYPTNCIALSPTGALLAAAYEGGVEIFSLAQGALPTDRRAVRCPRMDRLAFSEDSSTLLGTTVRINVSSTMAVSVPVFPSSPTNIPSHEELKEAWCSDLLHPENIRNSSHAVFMREKRETCNDRVFAWNGLEDTFGILNLSDLQYGAIDFPVVISPPLSTCGGLGAAIHSPPAIDEHGDTVAMIVNDRTIRLYIVPHKLDDGETSVEAHSIDHELDEGYGCPFTEVRWVYSTSSLPAPATNQTHVQGRLVVTSPGGVVEPGLSEENVDDIEGGRIILFDFDPQFAGQPGQTFSLTLGKSQPQLLEEPEVDVAEEVALVRRRTVNQSRGVGLSTRPITLGRAASTFGRRDERSARTGAPSIAGRQLRNSLLSLSSDVSRSLPDLMETSEALDTFEEPYAQGAPRSQASLQRAASNAQRHRFQTIEERNREQISVDSTGNFLALPEYTEEPNAPLPRRFRALAGLDLPAGAPATKPAIVTNQDGDRLSPTSPSTAPLTAPAAMAESFSADQAFHAATMLLQTQGSSTAAPRSPTAPSFASAEPQFSPVSRSGTFDSFSSMPRSLQRAYGNAPPGAGPPPFVLGDWEVVSPLAGPEGNRAFTPPSQSSTFRPADLPLPDWTRGGPQPVPTPRHPPSSPFGRAAQSSMQYRYSTSLLNPPGHQSPPTTMSSLNDGETSPTSTTSSRTRRLPLQMQAFRNAAGANSAASLFPPNQTPDHIPVREPVPNAGSVPHPVTAWHPPQPSSASARGHSRKSSASNRSAFASTEKAKKLGFFRAPTQRRRKRPAFEPEYTPGNGLSPRRGDESVLETKTMLTTLTRGEGKCVVM